MKLIFALVLLSPSALALRENQKMSLEVDVASNNGFLCRCEMQVRTPDGTARASGDCVRVQTNWKSKEGNSVCYNAKDIQKHLKSATSKLKLKKIDLGDDRFEASCHLINIDGVELSNSDDPVYLPLDKPLPKGVSYCNPGNVNPDAPSPMIVFAQYFNGVLDGTIKVSDPAPISSIEMEAPRQLYEQCPKTAFTQDGQLIPGVLCDSTEPDIMCCNGGEQRPLEPMCRLSNRASHTSGMFSSGRFMPVPVATVDALLQMDESAGNACCSGIAVLSKGGWECRDVATREDMTWQLKGDMKYRSYAIFEFMRHVYSELLPIEQSSLFNSLQYDEMTEADFRGKAQVLLVGGYSTGKTTFIRNLIGKDFPGMHISVEPTTDKFTVVQNGETRQVPGFVLAQDKKLPYGTLGQHVGTNFLDHFFAAQVNSPILHNITLVDTPGILAGKKQFNRGYDFRKAVEWFADRSDQILLFFDVFSLDISDELGQAIQILVKNGNHQKVSVILNKADQVTPDVLMRAHGAVMWYLSKVISSPEAIRTYIGNFGGHEYQNKELSDLFDREQDALNNKLLANSLNQHTQLRKVNTFIRRISLLKAHVILMHDLHSKMPSWTGKEKAQKKMLSGLSSIVESVAATNGIQVSDFGDLDLFRRKVEERSIDFSNIKIKSLKKTIGMLDEVLTRDVPALAEAIGDLYGEAWTKFNQ